MKPVFLFASLLLAFPALAIYSVPEIIVSATRSHEHDINTPVNIHTISRDEISSSGAKHISELLTGQAGIHLADPFGDGSNATIDMRGFGSSATSNTLIMIDGRKLNSASDSATLYLNSIPLINIERIEIIQGSSGVLFGNQAVGGVINIITRQPTTDEAALQASVGSFNQKSTSARFSGVSENGFSYQFSGHINDSDNYRDHNRSELKNFESSVNYAYNSGNLFLEYHYMSENTEMPGALFEEELKEDRRQSVDIYQQDYIDTISQVWRLGLHHDLDKHWQLKAEASQRNDDRDFILSFRGFPGSTSTQHRKTKSLTPRLVGKYDTQLGQLITTLGMDSESTDYQLNTAFGPQGTAQNIIALYGQINFPLSEKWNLTTGLRHARVKNDINNNGNSEDINDQVTVGSIGLNYQLSDYWKFFARADQNYRFAKVDEHTNVIFGQPTGLDTQTGISYELGVATGNQYYEFTAQTFRLDLENEISFDSSTFFNINLDSTQRTGISLSGKTWITDDWLFGINYDYIDSEITDGAFAGNNIPLVPEHEARLYLKWLPGNMSEWGFDMHYVASQVLGNDYSNNFNHLPAYTVFNTYFQHFHRNWEFIVRVNNVFNKEYTAAGAVGFDENFVSQAGYNPSPERTLALSARYTF